MSLFLFGHILLILISLTNAIPLGGTCTRNEDCDGSGVMICQDRECRCDTPWYRPCGTAACNPINAFVYEGQECRNDVNCFENAVCNTTERRCRCNSAYRPINGLCYKSLNISCTLSNECWSGECRDSLCKCPLGYIPRVDNSRCQRKLARIYANWTYANASGDFCYESGSNGCLAPYAICQSDSQRPEMFCQCPPTFTANYATQRCEIKINTQSLSPSTSSLPIAECGRCENSNAVCARVSNQTTCWCRASFTRTDDKTCNKNIKSFVFPNANDINQHRYDADCSTSTGRGAAIDGNRLCACASGYKFVDKTSSCQRIVPKWENNNFEYGVCTHINSRDDPVQENGICPDPLRCEARQDKYVCSCGRDKYFDEERDTCYYFLERNLTAPITNDCPPLSVLNGIRCQCSPNGVYTTSADNRRCELTLSEFSDNQANPACVASNPTNNDLCANFFHGNIRLCKQGECRCLSGSSYYANNTCVTLINVNPGTNGICPVNAYDNGGSCTCNLGYRIRGMNRTCERKVNQLNEPISILTESSDNSVTAAECAALFPDQPVDTSTANDQCQCANGAFNNGTICVFHLDFSPILSVDSRSTCPNDASLDALANPVVCRCNSGYRNSNNRTCERLTDRVYEYNDINGVNVLGLDTPGCGELFGRAAEVTQNDGYCRCRDESVAFLNNNRCYFLVEIDHTPIIITEPDCPPTSENRGGICNCPVGYQATTSKRGCERKVIYSSSLQTIDLTTQNTRCNTTYTDEDCEALHGLGAVCRNDTCFCDRSRSFVGANQCVLYSKFIFPGTHERHLHACDRQEDCGTNADNNGIECNYINANDNYKVCKCKSDYIYNPNDSTCVKTQCYPRCSDTEECNNYRCGCKVGHYRNPSGQCVIQPDTPLKLHNPCNISFWNEFTSSNQEFVCSSNCERFECAYGYRDDGSKCVKNNFDDRCAYFSYYCSQFSSHSTCDTDENKCTCSPYYYRTQGQTICARAVGYSCEDHTDCGDFGQCSNRECRCRSGGKEEEITDLAGRRIIRCISGVDQIRFSPVLLLFIIFARVFFA